MRRFCFIVVLSAVFISCVKDVDFSQAENISISPIAESSLFFSKIEASRFSFNGTEITTIRDSITNIDLFENDYFTDNLIKAEINLEISNTIDRTFTLQMDYFNANNDLLGISFPVTILPLLTEQTHTEVYENLTLDELKTITKIRITYTLEPSSDGSVIDDNTPGEIDFKSKAILYLQIDSN